MKKLKHKREIYLLTPDCSWDFFKEVWSLEKDPGPVAMNLDKNCYKLLKEKRIFVWLTSYRNKTRIGLGVKLPNNVEVNYIKNGKKYKKGCIRERILKGSYPVRD